MTEIIERVAWTLFVEDNKSSDLKTLASAWNAPRNVDFRPKYRRFAVAAIQAMREPLWGRLKAIACADPAEAKRIVMLSRSDFDEALSDAK